jgi:hypothetical protein
VKHLLVTKWRQRRFFLLVVPIVVTLSACGGATSSNRLAATTTTTTQGPSEVMRQWLRTNGAVIESLETPADNFVQAELPCPAESLSACVADVRPACVALAAVVSGAQKVSPFPSEVGERHWAESVADYSAAVTDCTSGTTEPNLPLLQDAVAKANTAQSETTDLLDVFGP